MDKQILKEENNSYKVEKIEPAIYVAIRLRDEVYLASGKTEPSCRIAAEGVKHLP